MVRYFIITLIKGNKMIWLFSIWCFMTGMFAAYTVDRMGWPIWGGILLGEMWCYIMAKRWNGKKMSHGSKNLPRPVKSARKILPKPTKKRSATWFINQGNWTLINQGYRMVKYQIRHDIDGYYVCTKQEARHEEMGRCDFSIGRPHFKTMKEAKEAVKLRIAKCTK